MLEGDDPVVSGSDYIRSLAEQIRSQISGRYKVLGTDGFGRSDTRQKLRHFFEVDRQFIELAALTSLAENQQISSDVVVKARDAMGIDPEKSDPMLV
jgi:pyruvate dehydrogenase E1 component